MPGRDNTKKKVFCIGLSRTGTTTLCNVLEELGYSTIHAPLQLFTYPECITPDLHFRAINQLLPFQQKRFERQLKRFRSLPQEELFDTFDAFVDLPIPLYYKELDRKYPGSAFIYTCRDEEKWLKSIEWNVTVGSVLWQIGFIEEELIAQTYGDRRFNSKKYLDTYRTHQHDVLTYFNDGCEPQSTSCNNKKLLVINLDKGEMNYEKICNFLEVPVLKGNIPKSNEARNVTMAQRIIYQFRRNVPFLLEAYHKFGKLRSLSKQPG